MKKYAIIVAGGSGTRMKRSVPKQFLLIDKKPILVHTLEKFTAYDAELSIVLTLPKAHFTTWQKIQTKYFPDTEIKTVSGGATRTASVISGLKELPPESLVAVHDAVRPFISHRVIDRSFISALKFGSGVASVPLKDAIRELNNKGLSASRKRANYVLVQTPQTFHTGSLQVAYEKVGFSPFTDDASVFECAGNPVHLVEGDYANIKITTPDDLGN